MSRSFAGKCQCGAVSATIAGDPIGVRQCWCRQCQQVAGGSATTNVMFLADDVSMTGTLAKHSYVADSGNTLTHFYCGACGTPVAAQSSARMHMLTVRIGFLDPGHGLRPQAVIWTDDAPDWALIDPDIDQFPRQPPAPATK